MKLIKKVEKTLVGKAGLFPKLDSAVSFGADGIPSPNPSVGVLTQSTGDQTGENGGAS